MGTLKNHRRGRTLFLVGLLASVSLSARAADTLSSLKRCRAIADDVQRLTCYDQLTPDSQATTGSAASTAPKVLTSTEKFGLSAAAIETKTQANDSNKPAGLQQIDATVKSIVKLGNGRLQFTLSNDQIWVQVQPSSDDWIAVGQSVHIKAGALGSYLLKNEHGLAYKVHRVD
jgi:hypothetical protein